MLKQHLEAWRKMLAEGRNEATPAMPFRQLCTIVSDAIKQVSSENIKTAFKQTLFSLNPDGSEDAPAFEDLPDKYKIKVTFPP